MKICWESQEWWRHFALFGVNHTSNKSINRRGRMSWPWLETCGLSSILVDDQSLPPERLISRSSRSLSLSLATSSSQPSWSRSSPPSQSSGSQSAMSPLSPQPLASAKNKSLYMFFQHSQGEVSHSLYAVEIPSGPFPPMAVSKESLMQSPIKNSHQIFPTLLFYCSDNFPYGMGCVQLDSKFYFLGGEMEIQQTTLMGEETETDTDDYDPAKEAAELFPSKVYILNTAIATSISNANASKFLTPAFPMETGKSQPLVFVASGKIYALSGPPIGNGMKLFDYIQYFEVFDPETNEWTPLPPPPSNYYHNSTLKTHSIVKNKLYLWLSPDASCIYCFDLINNEWIPSYELKCHNFFSTRISHVADFVDHSLYALLESTLVAFGPVNDTNEEDGEFFNHMVRFSEEKNYCLHPLLVYPVCFLFHLGNKRFCYVVTGNPPQQPLPEKWKYMKINPQTLYISFTIFDALTASIDGCTYPVAKPLHYSHYVADTPWNKSHPIPRNLLLTPIAASDAGFGGKAEL